MAGCSYRIYTEKKNVKIVSMLVNEGYGGFSMWFGTGFWQGHTEETMCIEIICTGSKVDDLAIKEICEKIKGVNRQDAVLCTKTKNIYERMV